ncbi:MAG TPA: ABC transporter substrate-binding protein [Candidatus Binatia bacterium]
MKRIRIQLTTMFIIAIGCATPQGVPPVYAENLKVVITSFDSSNAAIYLPYHTGLYKKYGLNVDLVYIGSSTIALQSLISGQVPISVGSGGTVIRAALGGADLVMVAGFLQTLPYSLVATDKIRRAEDLKGKTVGVSRFGSASDDAARLLLKAISLQPGKDVAIVQLGGFADRAAALSKGAVAAISGPPGTLELLPGGGVHNLVQTSDLATPPPFPFINLATTKSYLAKNRETVKRALMAQIEGVHYIKNNEEGTKRILGMMTKGATPGYLQAAYDALKKLIEERPLVSREGVNDVIQMELAKRENQGRTLSYEEVADMSLVRELEQEGFLKKIFGGK